MTKSEIIKLQRLLGLPQDGIAGRAYEAAIKRYKRQIRMKSIHIIFNV